MLGVFSWLSDCTKSHREGGVSGGDGGDAISKLKILPLKTPFCCKGEDMPQRCALKMLAERGASGVDGKWSCCSFACAWCSDWCGEENAEGDSNVNMLGTPVVLFSDTGVEER